MPTPVVLVYSLLDHIVAVAVRALPLSLRVLGWRRLSITICEYDTCMCIPDTNDTDTLGRAALHTPLPPTSHVHESPCRQYITIYPILRSLSRSVQYIMRRRASRSLLCNYPHGHTTGTWLIHTFRSHGQERKAWATPRPLHVGHISSLVHKEAQARRPMQPGHARGALPKIQRDLYSKHRGQWSCATRCSQVHQL